MPAATPYSSSGKLQDFITARMEKPLVALLVFISKRLPEPTRNNTNKYNTHLIIYLRDWFEERDETPVRHEAYRGLFNFLAYKYDRDNHHADRLDEVLKEWLKTDWQFKEGGRPTVYWKQDEPTSERPRLQKALVEALNNGEFDKVLGLID